MCIFFGRAEGIEILVVVRHNVRGERLATYLLPESVELIRCCANGSFPLVRREVDLRLILRYSLVSEQSSCP